MATFLSLGLAVFFALRPTRKATGDVARSDRAEVSANGTCAGVVTPVPLGGGLVPDSEREPGAAPMSLYVGQWMARLRAARLESHKCQALRHLGISGEPSAVQTILEVYRTARRPELRYCAIDALGETGASEAMNWLGEIARGSDPGLTGAAFAALAMSRSEAAHAELLELAHGDSPKLQRDAIIAMGQAGWPEAGPLLVGALERANGRDKTALVYALGEAGDPSSVPMLLKLAQQGGPGEMRAVALEALGHIGGPDALAFLVQEARGKNAPTAVNALAQMSDEAAQKALAELSRSPGPAQVQALQETMINAPQTDPRVREQARAALIRIAHQGGKDATEAVNALGQDESLESARELAAIARGNGPQAEQAVMFLGHRDDPESVRTVAELAEGSSPARAGALQALAEAGDPRSLGIFLRASESQDASSRTAALAGLAQLGGPEADRILESAIRSSDASTRRQAAEAMSSSGNPDMQSRLEALARDGDPQIAATVNRMYSREGTEVPPAEPCAR
ncbi:HEAT repeat domain-containing protein [Pendulispora brunnea]|uniref:HEAT repeat domain-containing protein n=1 Tax=Pendulispora brunnea TaxID=2905690 RepID=A0ABZ2KR15_9BACT